MLTFYPLAETTNVGGYFTCMSFWLPSFDCAYAANVVLSSDCKASSTAFDPSSCRRESASFVLHSAFGHSCGIRTLIRYSGIHSVFGHPFVIRTSFGIRAPMRFSDIHLVLVHSIGAADVSATEGITPENRGFARKRQNSKLCTHVLGVAYCSTW